MIFDCNMTGHYQKCQVVYGPLSLFMTFHWPINLQFLNQFLEKQADNPQTTTNIRTYNFIHIYRYIFIEDVHRDIKKVE